jgi:AraC-like DNA-binding protein/tetratricopeptide (TPR) repeat protein
MGPEGDTAIASSIVWRTAREGDLRGALEAARRALEQLPSASAPAERVDLYLAVAFCSMRGGDYAEATRALDVAAIAAAAAAADPRLVLRVKAWRAELAYFQGRYSAAKTLVDEVLDRLEAVGDWAYAAFAMRIRIAILLARADYEGIAHESARALRDARASGDDYAHVQVLNILGAAHFDCATSKLAEPHARAHLSSLDLPDMQPMTEEASIALRYFEDARELAQRGGYAFAAWYVSGNIERLQILLGKAEKTIVAIRRRLRTLQQRGARYDEIVARSNLAWGLRTLGLYRDALHELDVALRLARDTGTYNVLLEFLEYDRSIVLGALGDVAGSRASYRRYVRLVRGGAGGVLQEAGIEAVQATPRRPLEPHFLKRADRYILDHLETPISMAALAAGCGVSIRTLEKGFSDFRGLTPVAHIRNLRLDRARETIVAGTITVSEVAARCGFRSPTTFANEYRRRFGVPPSRTLRTSQSRPA